MRAGKRRLPLRELQRDGEVRDGDGSAPARLALHDDPERHRLDAPGREAPPDLLPEEVGDLVADEPVDDPPRLLRGDAVRVDLAGLAIAVWMALFVISWNSARWKRAEGAEGRRSSSRCQQIASPSRSGSPAR